MAFLGFDLSLSVGTSLAGRYSVGRVLGQGGFGITYLGADKLLGRPVAIKELVPEGSIRNNTQLIPPSSLRTTWREMCQRFLEEARTLARFDNPSIVKVFDVLEENGTIYLVMERLEGCTLGDEIEKQGALNPKTVESIALKLCEALDIVHRAGLLHRDLKPENVFLTIDGRAVLIDFGSARGFRDNKTAQYTRLVTPGYAPLEQYAETSNLGPYTDLYALGATLYHMLTGKRPPSATDRVLGSQLEWSTMISSGSSPIRDTVEKAMQIKIADRPINVDEMVNLLVGKIPAVTPMPSMKPVSPAPTHNSIQARKEAIRLLTSDIGVRLSQAESLATDTRVLEVLANDKSVDVRILVAKNPNTPIAILQLLLKDEKTIVTQSIGLNTNVTDEFLNMLLNSRSTVALKPFAENKLTPVKALRLLFQRDSWFTACLARNPSCPPDILDNIVLRWGGRMHNDPSQVETLISVAAHLNTQPSTLDLLAEIPSNGVVLNVARNPNTMEHTLEKLTKHVALNVRIYATANLASRN
jgi:serine/threonine protein kinase